ncbi:MAG: hypothetical protein MdMp014T_2359 [Treponematales bacterium]
MDREQGTVSRKWEIGNGKWEMGVQVTQRRGNNFVIRANARLPIGREYIGAIAPVVILRLARRIHSGRKPGAAMDAPVGPGNDDTRRGAGEWKGREATLRLLSIP